MAAQALMVILLNLLLKHDNEVASTISMVQMESNNGYDLLWRVLELTVLGFNPTNPVKLLLWHNDDIFEFAHAFLLYYHLQGKKGVWYDNRTRSTMFLQAVDDPAYVDTITTLIMCINNYYTSYDKGYLPAALCVMGLAHQLNKMAESRAKSILPRAHQMDGRSHGRYYSHDKAGILHYDVPIQGVPCVYRMEGSGRDRPPPHNGRGEGPAYQPCDGCNKCNQFQPRSFTPSTHAQGPRTPSQDPLHG
jgi:hypothetical protein